MVDQDVMKGPHSLEDTTKTKTPNERESKFARVKRMLTCQTTKSPITYDEAKASVKARKRKERQESVSSISQERKVIRSNSEERPINAKNDIRRVSSNEDFQKSPQQPSNDGVATLAINEGPMKISPHREYGVDDGEFERRRSHERFSRPLVQRGRYNQRRPKSKQFSKTKDKITASRKKHDEDRSGDNVKEPDLVEPQAEVEKERSPSPVRAPAIDLSTLHQQIDNSDPLPSNRDIDDDADTVPTLSVASNRLLSSPRNSVIITQRIYLNPDVPQHPSLAKDPKNPVEQRLKQLAKQINGLKKKIKKYDDEFEARHGYRPSHADKLNDKSIKKLCGELNKLKKEQKQLQEDSTTGGAAVLGGGSTPKRESPKPTVTLKETVIEIEKRLESKRKVSERTDVVEDLRGDEILDEKVAVQKALLYLESIHGRPTNKEDKDLARPLYDRYRTLKRMVARCTMVSSVNELATIHEHETMDFVSLPTQIAEPESEERQTLTGSTDSDTDTSIGENLHALTLDELLDQQKITNEEKKRLRRSIKEFESDFETKSGRKLQKEDRAPVEALYTSYKKAKAKLRLLDALVGKQSTTTAI